MIKVSLQKPVLIVDDEADLRALMEMTLTKMGLSVCLAQGAVEAKRYLNEQMFSLVLTDMRMPDGSGLDIINHIIQENLDIPVAVITAYGNAAEATEALKKGAFDYLQKPITLAQLRSLVKSAIHINEGSPAITTRVESSSRQPAPTEDESFKPNSTADQQITDLEQRLMGNSPSMVEARKMILKLAKTNIPVYISGESGSGKEQAARSIHDHSSRRDKTFVAVNCGAIPENLMESEFFGYKKGSFTGADSDRLGFFQHAHGGTLFLDEIADLPLAMQVKLLRAIQNKAVRRIGESEERAVDVRLVCATHKDLRALVASGDFRQDLFYRITVVSLFMPPLREMREDLPHFIQFLLKKCQNDQPIAVSKEAEKVLLDYSYPGNFRELENILERAVVLCQDHVIQVNDLQINSHQELEDLHQELDAPESFHGDLASLVGSFETGKFQLQEFLDTIERRVIEQALKQTRYNRTQAAKLIGISFRSMRYRMARLSIE